MIEALAIFIILFVVFAAIGFLTNIWLTYCFRKYRGIDINKDE